MPQQMDEKLLKRLKKSTLEQLKSIEQTKPNYAIWFHNDADGKACKELFLRAFGNQGDKIDVFDTKTDEVLVIPKVVEGLNNAENKPFIIAVDLNIKTGNKEEFDKLEEYGNYAWIDHHDTGDHANIYSRVHTQSDAKSASGVVYETLKANVLGQRQKLIDFLVQKNDTEALKYMESPRIPLNIINDIKDKYLDDLSVELKEYLMLNPYEFPKEVKQDMTITIEELNKYEDVIKAIDEMDSGDKEKKYGMYYYYERKPDEDFVKRMFDNSENINNPSKFFTLEEQEVYKNYDKDMRDKADRIVDSAVKGNRICGSYNNINKFVRIYIDQTAFKEGVNCNYVYCQLLKNNEFMSWAKDNNIDFIEIMVNKRKVSVRLINPETDLTKTGVTEQLRAGTRKEAGGFDINSNPGYIVNQNDQLKDIYIQNAIHEQIMAETYNTLEEIHKEKVPEVSEETRRAVYEAMAEYNKKLIGKSLVAFEFTAELSDNRTKDNSGTKIYDLDTERKERRERNNGTLDRSKDGKDDRIAITL